MNHPIDPEDQALFRESISQIPDANPRTIPHEHDTNHHIHIHEPDTWVGAESPLFYAIHGLQDRVIKKLRRGQMRATRSIDLHGHQVEEACKSLHHFILIALQDGIRVIRVIHGKGDPEKAILKSHVNAFLQAHPSVRAFCSALAHEGGTGALTVLIQSKTHKEL